MSEEKEAAKVDEAHQIWQQYLQRCCEVGQLLHAVDQLDAQKRDIEKKIEVTQREVKSLAHKHSENKAKGLVPKPEDPSASGAANQVSH